MFLRGFGEQEFSGIGKYKSMALGLVQGDAIRNITAHVGSGGGNAGAFRYLTTVTDNGAFYMSQAGSGIIYPQGGATSYYVLNFDASRVVPTTDGEYAENRPVNKAVKFLIRAKP